jgi:thiol-disulfide isomerase/thioredoxin
MKTKQLLIPVIVTLGLILGGPLFAQDWREIPLRDVISGEIFQISDFEGQTVLLESFAVWCPTCTKQQQEVRKLHEQIGNRVVSISLDVDPNEDEELVREHAIRNGFDWLYAVAPPELTRALIAEFGTAIVAAPSAPMILICGDRSEHGRSDGQGADEQGARLLKRGVKKADRLLEEIERGCSS